MTLRLIARTVYVGNVPLDFFLTRIAGALLYALIVEGRKKTSYVHGRELKVRKT
jgi:hypothetical protein